jgi:thiol-disulfide isomerase/thioredoxin
MGRISREHSAEALFSSNSMHLGTQEIVLLCNADKELSSRCGHCRKLAPIWTQLAKRMQHKLAIAEVNCEDHGVLCQSQGVQGYPMLFFYANGEKVEYTGGRTLDKLEAFVDKVSKPLVPSFLSCDILLSHRYSPVQELVLEDFEAHVKNNSVVYLVLHSVSNAKILVRHAKMSSSFDSLTYILC